MNFYYERELKVIVEVRINTVSITVENANDKMTFGNWLKEVLSRVSTIERSCPLIDHKNNVDTDAVTMSPCNSRCE